GVADTPVAVASEVGLAASGVSVPGRVGVSFVGLGLAVLFWAGVRDEFGTSVGGTDAEGGVDVKGTKLGPGVTVTRIVVGTRVRVANTVSLGVGLDEVGDPAGTGLGAAVRAVSMRSRIVFRYGSGATAKNAP